MVDAARLGRTGPRVAVIEDEEPLRRLMTQVLEGAGYETVAVADGENGLRAVHEHQADLVLLDLTHSRPDSVEVCARLRADPRTTMLPVIVLAARRSLAGMLGALDAGADDFLAKPPSRTELLARVRAVMQGREIVRRMEQAHAIVATLANAVEAKDPRIDGHCRRLAYRAARLAASVGLRGEQLEAVAFGALLHDIGKIAIPDVVLNKAGPLTADELELLRDHPEIGGRICEPLQTSRGFAPIIRHHHEYWDGTGYPHKLAGEEIPLGARIVAIADAYDAITFGRPYRRPRPHEEAVAELRRCAGTQFDPALVPIFIDETERLESGLPPAAELPLTLTLGREIPIAPRAASAA